jgi:hypothetical protein
VAEWDEAAVDLGKSYLDGPEQEKAALDFA